MSVDSRVADHYGGADLVAAIRHGLAQLGKDPDAGDVMVDDLAPVDEFHIGGRIATADLGAQLGLDRSHRLLDVGCGIGGPARFLAATFGCEVSGIDLTPAFVATGQQLTAWTGLTDRVKLVQGSALDLPFPDGHFDRAIQLHVGMNVADKAALFVEVSRVLAPGGRFAVYDVMRLSDDALDYPVPWASDESMSFLEPVVVYRRALEAAGFVVTAERERDALASEFFAGLAARAAEAGGPAPLGPHLFMGADMATKIGNLVAALEARIVAPVELIGEKPVPS